PPPLDEREHLGALGGSVRGIGEALVKEDLDRAVGLGAQLRKLLLDLDKLRFQALPGPGQYVVAERHRILPCRQALNRTAGRAPPPTRRSLQQIEHSTKSHCPRPRHSTRQSIRR